MNVGEIILSWIKYAAVDTPAILLSLVTLPLILLARWKNIYPAKPLIWLVLLPVIPSLSIAFRPIASMILMIAILALSIGMVGRYLRVTGNGTLILLSLVVLVAALSVRQDPLPVILVVDALILAVMES